MDNIFEGLLNEDFPVHVPANSSVERPRIQPASNSEAPEALNPNDTMESGGGEKTLPDGPNDDAEAVTKVRVSPANLSAEPGQKDVSDILPGREGRVKPDTSSEGSTPSAPTNDLAATLDKIVAYLEHYVNFPFEGQSITCAIWAVHTHVFDRFRYSPYLHIFSPEKRCGKSNLLDALALIVARPWKVENLSEASLFHKADNDKSTMLWDEVDQVFKDDQRYAPIIGLLNGGFKRGGRAARCPRGVFTEYDVYCPKVITGIGKIPDTLHDRCIDIRLARAKPPSPFREEDAEDEAKEICEALVEFATNLGPNEHKVIVNFPGEYIENGRMCDITEPLLSLAFLAGQEWYDKVHDSLADLCSNMSDMSVGMQLIKDCRDIFLTRNAEKIFSQTLINDLIDVEDADSPWPVWWEGDVKNGKTRGPAKKLATLLGGYGIKPHTIRLGTEQAKGYIKADFADAWKRYLPEVGKMVTRELALDL
jgi:hypothetical protein